MAIEDEKTIPIDNIHSFDSALKDADDLLDTKIPAWVENGPATYRQRALRWLWSQKPESIQKEVDSYHARNRLSQFFYWLFNINDIAWKVQWQAHQDIVNQMKKDKEAFKENKESFLKNKNFMTPYENFLNQSSVPSVWRRGWNSVLSSIVTWWNTLFQPQQSKQKIMARRLSEPTPGESKSMFRVQYVTSRLRAASIGARKEKNALTEDQQKDFYYICGFFGLVPERVTRDDLKEACHVLLKSVAQVSQHDIKIRLQKAAQLFNVLPKKSFSYSLFSTLAETKQVAAIKQANADRKPATTPRMLTFEQPKKEEEKEKKEKISEAPLIQLNERESEQMATILGLSFKTAGEIKAQEDGIIEKTGEFKWNIGDEIPVGKTLMKRRLAILRFVHPDRELISTEKEKKDKEYLMQVINKAYQDLPKSCKENGRVRLLQKSDTVRRAYDDARKKMNPTYITNAEAEMNEFKRKIVEQTKKEMAELERQMVERQKKAEKEMMKENQNRARGIVKRVINRARELLISQKKILSETVVNELSNEFDNIEQVIPDIVSMDDAVFLKLEKVADRFAEEIGKISLQQSRSSDMRHTATEAPTPTPSPAPVTIASPNSHIHGLFDAMASVPTTTTPPVLKEEEKQNHQESNEAVSPHLVSLN